MYSEKQAGAGERTLDSQRADCWNPFTSATELAYWDHFCPDWSAAQRARICAAYRAAAQALEQKLLTHGGERMVKAGYDPYLLQLLDEKRAQTWPATRRLCPMVPSACHRNSATLWCDDPQHLRIAHGFVLNGGIWRPHSWVVTVRARKPDTAVIETTMRREAYYGFVLTPEESTAFARANGAWSEDDDDEDDVTLDRGEEAASA